MIALLLLFAGQEPNVVETRADWCELNHVCEVTRGELGNQVVRITLSQVCFWQGPGRRRCIGWRLANKVDGIREDRSGVTITWHDGEVLRRVRAGFLIETATLEDVELVNRLDWPVEARRGLGTIAKRR